MWRWVNYSRICCCWTWTTNTIDCLIVKIWLVLMFWTADTSDLFATLRKLSRFYLLNQLAVLHSLNDLSLLIWNLSLTQIALMLNWLSLGWWCSFLFIDKFFLCQTPQLLLKRLNFRKFMLNYIIAAYFIALDVTVFLGL